MLEWLITAAGVILIVIAILAYFDAADVAIDLFTSLLQLVVAAVALTFTLLAALAQCTEAFAEQTAQRNRSLIRANEKGGTPAPSA